LQQLKKTGKIRHYGISNETPWGVHRYLTLANEYNIDAPVSIQNPYSLLNRTFEIGLAEMAIRENMGLMAYSPLAMGMLSGKYITGKDKPENRLNQFKYFSRYTKSNAHDATRRYLDIAKEYNLSLTQMALAFVNQQEFLTSNIIGATNLVQLEENIRSIELTLSAENIQKINEIHESNPNPTP
jgi:aryl-alcohol dehydrogenase-like predicted oxidoreductase